MSLEISNSVYKAALEALDEYNVNALVFNHEEAIKFEEAVKFIVKAAIEEYNRTPDLEKWGKIDESGNI